MKQEPAKIALAVMVTLLWVANTGARSSDTLWTKIYAELDVNRGNSVQQTKDGGYIIAGSSDSSGAADYDVYLIKTDAKGDTLWTRTYGGAGLDDGYAVQQTSDDGYIIAGCTGSVGEGYAVWLIRMRP